MRRVRVTERGKTQRGFTLLEVMIGLALLGLALTVLIKSAAGSIFNAEQAHMMGVATDLARGKMYDIEEILLKDGFTETDQSQESEECFKDEGWENICYSYKVEQPELPSFDELQQMAMGKAEDAAGSALGSAGSAFDGSAGDLATMAGSGGGLQNSALGGMLGMMGSFGGGTQDITATQGGELIKSQYTMFQDILKVSVRKVTLTVKWKVLGQDRDMKVIAYFTDAAAMDKVLSGMGSQELPDAGAGTGTTPGTGTGSGGTRGPTQPRPGAGRGSGR